MQKYIYKIYFFCSLFYIYIKWVTVHKILYTVKINKENSRTIKTKKITHQPMKKRIKNTKCRRNF